MSVALQWSTTFAKPPLYNFNRGGSGSPIFLPLPNSSSDSFHFSCYRPRQHKWDRLQPVNSLPEETVALSGTAAATVADEASVASPPADVLLEVKKRAVDLCSSLKGTSIFLLGTRCPLKSSLGELIADAFSYYFFDSDEVVAQAFGGESSAESAKENDQDGYRQSETEVFKQLTGMGRLVVCAGDGAVQSSTNLGLLRHGITLWIDVPLDMAARSLVKPQFDSPGSKADSDYAEVSTKLMTSYNELRTGYATADVIISLQRVATKFGYEKANEVKIEDLAIEAFKEIEKLTRVKKMMEEAGKPF